MGKHRNSMRLLALCLAVSLTLSPALAAPVIHGYSEGLALAEEGGRWGYADTAGRVVIPIQYDSAQSFRVGLAKVERGGRLGVVRADGKELIRPQYDTLSAIGYGLYIAQMGNFWGVVSVVPFPASPSGETQALFPVTYDGVTLGQSSGLSVLTLVKDGVPTVVPVSSLPARMAERRVPSAQFPLIPDRLPSFSDVGSRDWFAVWVNIAYNVGLMDGKGGGRFDPQGILTVGEAVKLAAFLESRHTGDDFHLQPQGGSPWYRSAVTYCVAIGILKEGEFDSYDRPITRAEMARLFAATSLGRSMPTLNDPARVKKSLPDVKEGDYAADAIWGLYAKGIFTGSDGAMTFRPADRLTRAEAAAIVARMARTEQRATLWSTKARSAPLPETSTLPMV